MSTTDGSNGTGGGGAPGPGGGSGAGPGGGTNATTSTGGKFFLHFFLVFVNMYNINLLYFF